MYYLLYHEDVREFDRSKFYDLVQTLEGWEMTGTQYVSDPDVERKFTGIEMDTTSVDSVRITLKLKSVPDSLGVVEARKEIQDALNAIRVEYSVQFPDVSNVEQNAQIDLENTTL